LSKKHRLVVEVEPLRRQKNIKVDELSIEILAIYLQQ